MAGSKGSLSVVDPRRILVLLWCIGGIYTFFIIWAVLQERVTAEPYVSDDGKHSVQFKAITVLNLVQACCAAVLGWAAMKLRGLGDCGTPASAYFRAAVSNTFASPCGYASIQFTSYLFLAVGKSCKLVPVMLFNFVMNKTKLTLYQVGAVILISSGIVAFKLYDKADYDGNVGLATAIGCGLVLANLAFDGYTSATQDGIFKAGAKRAIARAEAKGETVGPDGAGNTVSAYHVMFYVNFWAVWILIVWLGADYVLSSQPEVDQVQYLLRHFPEALVHVVTFSMLGAIGQLFIYYSIAEFGTLVTTTICITRKFWSIMISVLRSTRPIAAVQAFGILAVFAGLGLSVWDKYQKQKARVAARQAALAQKKDE